MIGPRDIAWGVGIGAMLVLGAQSYPLWSAERRVAHDAEQAFAHVFEGRRMVDGDLIQREGTAAAPLMFAPPIFFRRLEVTTEHVDWNGKHVELLLEHVVGFDRTLDELNPTHEVLVRLEKQGGVFAYTQFQVRGQSPQAMPNDGNPWFVIMHAALEAERRDASKSTPNERPVERME